LSERRSTALILVDEFHYLALEEKLKLIQSLPNPDVLDRLSILRILGQTTKGTDESEKVDMGRPWETENIKSYHKHNYDYHFWNPKHAAFDLQEQSDYYIKNDYPKVPIEYLETQVDIYPESKYIYRLGFFNQKLPKTSDTYRSALSRIERYRKDYDLYTTTKAHGIDNLKMWLGSLYCLELKHILRGPKERRNASWGKSVQKSPSNVTKQYLEVDVNDTEDFFPRLVKRTGGMIEWGYKIYNPDRIGWQIERLVPPP